MSTTCLPGVWKNTFFLFFFFFCVFFFFFFFSRKALSGAMMHILNSVNAGEIVQFAVSICIKILKRMILESDFWARYLVWQVRP